MLALAVALSTAFAVQPITVSPVDNALAWNEARQNLKQQTGKVAVSLSGTLFSPGSSVDLLVSSAGVKPQDQFSVLVVSPISGQFFHGATFSAGLMSQNGEVKAILLEDVFWTSLVRYMNDRNKTPPVDRIHQALRIGNNQKIAVFISVNGKHVLTQHFDVAVFNR